MSNTTPKGLGPNHNEYTVFAPLDTPHRRTRYLMGDFPRAADVKDLDKRYRWDLLWDSTRRLELSGYANAHIDTALRALVRPLKDGS